MLPGDMPCEGARMYYEYMPLHVMQWVQMIISYISVVVVIYTTKHFLCRRSIFDQAFKELLLTLYFFIIVHAALLGVLQNILIIARMASPDPCEGQISKLFCFCIRITVTIPLSGLVCVNLSFTIQRILSSCVPDHRFNIIASRGLIAFSFIYPIGITILAYGSDDYSGRVPYCTASTEHSIQVNTINVFVMFGLDTLTCLTDFALLKYNQYMLRTRSFDVNVTFRRRQNIYATQEFLPSAIFHALCYFVQTGTILAGYSFHGRVDEVTFVTINTYAYLMPYYCLICPLILLYLMKKGKLMRSEGLRNAIRPLSEDVKTNYFNALRDQWNVNVRIPPERRTHSIDVSGE